MELEQIRGLVELMVDNDLSRIEIHEGQTHILLKRGGTVVQAAPMSMAMPASAHAAAPVAGPALPATAPTTVAAPSTEPSNERVVRSPMVGTFYASPDPDSPAFVKVGDMVGPDTVVCLIEAMKVFNEIKAECSGRVARMLAQNAQAVEYDQPLLAVVPA